MSKASNITRIIMEAKGKTFVFSKAMPGVDFIDQKKVKIPKGEYLALEKSEQDDSLTLIQSVETEELYYMKTKMIPK